MKYAIIGAEGCIGARIVETLHLGDGAAIVAISPQAADHTLAARFSVDLRTAALDSADPLSKALERCSTAIYAARSEPQRLRKEAAVLVRAASAAGTRRIVYVSAAATADGAPLDSSDASRKGSGGEPELHAAPVAAERQFLTDCRRAGIMGVVLRAGIVYGPRSAMVAEVATELRDNRAWLVRGGSAPLNGIYVDNLVAAVRLCLKLKSAPGQPLYVGDAETITWRDFYHALAHELELSASRVREVDSIDALKPTPPLGGRAQGASVSVRYSLQQSTTKFDSAEASKVLGYAPVIEFREAIRRSCAWWRLAQGNWPTTATKAHP